MKKTLTDIFTNKPFWKEMVKSVFEVATAETTLLQETVRYETPIYRNETPFKHH